VRLLKGLVNVHTSKYYLALLGFVCLCHTTCAIAQNAKISAKEQITSAPNSRDVELDHMAKLITSLKAEIPNIQDPAAKHAAMDNLELWQHLFDRILLDNKAANNAGGAHHHDTNAVDPALKQSPKP
jgi:hypothetical protein